MIFDAMKANNADGLYFFPSLNEFTQSVALL